MICLISEDLTKNTLSVWMGYYRHRHISMEGINICQACTVQLSTSFIRLAFRFNYVSSVPSASLHQLFNKTMKNSFTPVVKSIFFLARQKNHYYTWLLMTSCKPSACRYMALCCIKFSHWLYRTNGEHLHYVIMELREHKIAVMLLVILTHLWSCLCVLALTVFVIA